MITTEKETILKKACKLGIDLQENKQDRKYFEPVNIQYQYAA